MLISIFLTVSAVEHPLMCLLATSASSLEKCSRLPSVAVKGTVTKSSLGRRGLISSHSLQFIVKKSQGRSSSQGPGGRAGAEAVEELGMVVQAFNPSIWESETGRSL